MTLEEFIKNNPDYKGNCDATGANKWVPVISLSRGEIVSWAITSDYRTDCIKTS